MRCTVAGLKVCGEETNWELDECEGANSYFSTGTRRSRISDSNVPVSAAASWSQEMIAMPPKSACRSD